jgi:hypothetical protein
LFALARDLIVLSALEYCFVALGISSSRYGYVGIILFFLAAVVVAYKLADSYIDRLPDHRGFHLVAVENAVSAEPLLTPQRTVVVVVDGLREDRARGMRSAQQLEQLGQCRTTDTGPLTISRPAYAVISTGLEQDRTGSRNNDDTSPIAVQSIWGVAQDAGLRVHAASNLEWWRELFPGAFTSYRFDLDEGQNFFILEQLSQLSLLHPVRVDTAGHDYGADSEQYRAATALIDRELSALMEGLDFKKDLLILTADHGHSGPGGHGGTAPEVARVLTCFAGPTIRSAQSEVQTDSRVIAPTIAVLLGLPFPKHMRAGDDDLDQIWSLVRTDLLGEVYVAERKTSIERFRSENTNYVGEVLGQKIGGWTELYAQGTRRHQLWWSAVGFFLAGMLVIFGRLRQQSQKQAAASVLWMAAGLLASCALYTLVRGSFDFTSINKRQEFLDASIGVSMAVAVLAAGLHLTIWRNLKGLLLDHVSLLVVLIVVSLAHPCIYGVTLGFPLPGRIAIFLPFILGALVIASGILAGILALLLLIRGLVVARPG